MFQLMERIRNLTTDYNKKFKVSANGDLWNKLCSSFDVIEDTGLAIETYLGKSYPVDDGKKYLHLYGLLQVLYVQQLALDSMCTALNQPSILNEPELKKIRDVRNDCTGHPTNRKNGLYFYIIRDSITPDNFRVLSYDKNNQQECRRIDIQDITLKQKMIIADVLDKCERVLKEALEE